MPKVFQINDAKFVSAKKDQYGKMKYVFQIHESVYNELDEMYEDLRVALEIPDDMPLYKSWFGMSKITNSKISDLLDESRPMLRFTRVSVENLPDFKVGETYSLTAAFKYYSMNKKNQGISADLMKVE